MQPRCVLDNSELLIATSTQQTANLSRAVIVIDGQRLYSALIVPSTLWLAADRTDTILLVTHPIIIVEAKPILAAKRFSSIDSSRPQGCSP